MRIDKQAPKDLAAVLAEERTDLAIRRTIIASERTLMAWIRTSLSMIGFGFSSYKFFQYLPEEIAAGYVKRPQALRNLGLSLISLGTLALINPRIVSPHKSYDAAQSQFLIPRKVVKGGSHLCAPNYCLRYRPAARQPQLIDTSMNYIGFRCIARQALKV